VSYPFSIADSDFKGKRVLVTGGTKGMGAVIVERFILSGACVATTARSPLPADQRPILFVQADIGTGEGASRIVERVTKEWGGIDILINCVGGSEAPNGGFQVLTDED
jgi:NAD(P)-dependent dehydrogenase (short-subunit alcohol dehydrogenase family)